LFNYLQEQELPSEECVPYNSTDGNNHACVLRKCTNESHKEFKVMKCNRVLYLDNIAALQYQLFKFGPVYCTFDCYKSGIYYRVAGSVNPLVEIRHGVKVIGWGEEEEVKFWLAMNSWRENGIFHIKMGDGNICDIAATCERKLD
jgi:hypothetical protein